MQRRFESRCDGGLNEKAFSVSHDMFYGRILNNNGFKIYIELLNGSVLSVTVQDR